MPNPLVSDRNVAFLLDETHDAAALCSLPYYADHSRETFEMFLGALEVGADRVAALAAAALIGLSLPIAVYATQVYPEIPGAFLTAAAVRRMLAAPGRRRTVALLTGVALGILLILTWSVGHFAGLGLPVWYWVLGYLGMMAATYAQLAQRRDEQETLDRDRS